MIKKLNTKKLTLKKETVAILGSNAMIDLKGGIDVTGCVDTACCVTQNKIDCYTINHSGCITGMMNNCGYSEPFPVCQ